MQYREIDAPAITLNDFLYGFLVVMLQAYFSAIGILLRRLAEQFRFAFKVDVITVGLLARPERRKGERTWAVRVFLTYCVAAAAGGIAAAAAEADLLTVEDCIACHKVEREKVEKMDSRARIGARSGRSALACRSLRRAVLTC